MKTIGMLGGMSWESTASYYKAINETIILGYTEIALLVQQKHTPVPLYDTTEIHAGRAVQHATSE